jgi:ankyrin repeat protein
VVMGEFLNGIKEQQNAQEAIILGRLSAFIQMEGNVNEPDIFGETLLIRSLDKGMHRVAMKLLENGADLNSVDSLGRTAVSYAFQSGAKDIIDVFVKAGVRFKISEYAIYDAFAHVCYSYREGSADVDLSYINYLLDNSTIDVTKSVIRGEPFLYFAIDTHSPSLVKLYFDRGGSIFIRNSHGMTPLSFSESKLTDSTERGFRSILKLDTEVKELLMEVTKQV